MARFRLSAGFLQLLNVCRRLPAFLMEGTTTMMSKLCDGCKDRMQASPFSLSKSVLVADISLFPKPV
jgi:hypothetical protein